MKKLLGPCLQFQLEPFAYAEFWDRTQDMQANNWTPQEIGVGPDIATFKRLSASDDKFDQGKLHWFKALWGQLTAFDQQRSEDMTLLFVFLFQPEEIRQFLIRMSWEERLHTEAYRYVVQQLGLPEQGPDSIYELWMNVPSLRARVEYAERVNEQVMDIFLRNQRNDLLHRCAGLPLNVKQPYNLYDKQTLLLALIFSYLIFEKVWFLINLSGPLQHMARAKAAGAQREFEGASAQLRYIARDEYQHIGGGVDLIKHFIRENPETITESFLASVQSMYNECLVLESDFAAYCCSVAPMVGYSVPDHIETAKFFANLGATATGFIPEPFPGAQHKFPWMSEMMDLKQEKNFFETRVEEYQGGRDLWGQEKELPQAEMDLWADPLGEK